MPVLSTAGVYGGPQTVAVNQCRELVRRGHAVTVAGVVLSPEDAPSREDLGVDAEVVQWGGHKVARSTFGSVVSIAAWREIRNLSERYDVTHVHYARDLGVGLAPASLDKPWVAQTHGMVTSGGSVAARALRRIHRRVLSSATAVLSLSEFEDKDLARAGIPAATTLRLRNGVDTDRFSPRPAVRNPERVERARAPRLVVFASRFHPRKRPRDFVRMAHLLVQSCGADAFQFVMVGPDEGEKARSVRLAAELGVTVDVREPCDEIGIHSLLCDAAVVVLPSVDEPYPMIALESMASGTPCVVTTSCGLAAPLAQDFPELVCAPSPERLAAAVEDVTSFERELGPGVRRWVEQNGSMSVVGDALEAVYAGVLERREDST